MPQTALYNLIIRRSSAHKIFFWECTCPPVEKFAREPQNLREQVADDHRTVLWSHQPRSAKESSLEYISSFLSPTVAPCFVMFTWRFYKYPISVFITFFMVFLWVQEFQFTPWNNTGLPDCLCGITGFLVLLTCFGSKVNRDEDAGADAVSVKASLANLSRCERSCMSEEKYLRDSEVFKLSCRPSWTSVTTHSCLS